MPRKWRLRLNWPFLLASLATVFLLGLLFVWRISVRISGPSLSEAEWQLAVVASCIETVIAIWFLSTGAAIGSFINVVAWRLPRGVSLLGPSRCPHCYSELGLQNNLPIFGWLKLRGRSSCCRLPIASGYLWIELFFVAVFGWIGFNELLSSGANLPSQPFRQAMSLEHRITKTAFGVQLFLYVWVVSGLIAIALMKLQRSQVPLRFFLWVAIPCFVVPLIAPSAIQVSWHSSQEATVFYPRIDALLSPVCGVFLGVVVGSLAEKIWSKLFNAESGSFDRWSTAGGVAIAGALLGWQAVPIVLMQMCLFALCSRFILSGKLLLDSVFANCCDANRLLPLSVWIWLAVLVYRSSWSIWDKLGTFIPSL